MRDFMKIIAVVVRQANTVLFTVNVPKMDQFLHNCLMEPYPTPKTSYFSAN